MDLANSHFSSVWFKILIFSLKCRFAVLRTLRNCKLRVRGGFNFQNDLEHSLQVNRFSPEWVLGFFYKVFTREGKESFWKWLLPKNGFSPVNGFSPKMVFPRKWLLLGNNFSPGNSKYITFQFNLRAYSWLRPMWILSLLFVENVLWQCLHTDFLKIK